jgi:hypothetical protein
MATLGFGGPDIPPDDLAYYRLGKPEVISKNGLLDSFGSIKQSNCSDISSCHLGSTVALSARRSLGHRVSTVSFSARHAVGADTRSAAVSGGSSSFSVSVVNIVNYGAEKEMVRANTQRNVAMMADVHAIGDIASVEPPRYTVCPFVSSSSPEPTITTSPQAGPQPTIARSVNLGPEPGDLSVGILPMHRKALPFGVTPRAVYGSAGVHLCAEFYHSGLAD